MNNVPHNEDDMFWLLGENKVIIIFLTTVKTVLQYKAMAIFF